MDSQILDRARQNIVMLCFALGLTTSINCQPSGDTYSAIQESARLIRLQELPVEINESSGLARLDQILVGNNDSGDSPRLYGFTANTDTIVQDWSIENANHVDWEDLAEDSNYVYIGDFGNNYGSRKDLAIYIIQKDSMRIKDQLTAEKISFTYPHQKTFIRNHRHNFDCEAMITSRDSLYLFTKNRGNNKTDLYALPKQSGDYQARWLGEFNSQGQITAADRLGQTIVLLGYRPSRHRLQPFIWVLSNFISNKFFSGNQSQLLLDEDLQTEGLLFANDSILYVTNEEEEGGEAWLYRLPITMITSK